MPDIGYAIGYVIGYAIGYGGHLAQEMQKVTVIDSVNFLSYHPLLMVQFPKLNEGTGQPYVVPDVFLCRMAFHLKNSYNVAILPG